MLPRTRDARVVIPLHQHPQIACHELCQVVEMARILGKCGFEHTKVIWFSMTYIALVVVTSPWRRIKARLSGCTRSMFLECVSWKAAGTVGFITSVCGDNHCVTRAVLSIRGVHDAKISYNQMLVLANVHAHF